MMRLGILAETYAVCRLERGAPIPAWALAGGFFSVTRTSDELSVVCEQAWVPAVVPDGAKAERDWRMFWVEGTLDFALTGILASIADPLRAARVSLFAVSTFDTDYVLVKSVDLERARAALKSAGFSFSP